MEEEESPSENNTSREQPEDPPALSHTRLELEDSSDRILSSSSSSSILSPTDPPDIQSSFISSETNKESVNLGLQTSSLRPLPSDPDSSSQHSLPSSLTPVPSDKKRSHNVFGRAISLPEGSTQSLEVEESPYLLPQTSGFIGSASAHTSLSLPELKRGRGRPRKDTLNPLARRPSSRGLSRGLNRPLGRPFGSSRGLGRVQSSRGAGRGSRGRRGRPPYPHSALVLSRSSPLLKLNTELGARTKQSPTDIVLSPPVLKPDILPPTGMAEFLRQSSVTTPTAEGSNSAPASSSGSPIQGTASSTPTDQNGAAETLQSPGHLCAMCNCGERSLLGQGEIWRFEPTPDFDVFSQPEPKVSRDTEDVETDGKNIGPQPTTWRRSRGPLKSGRERSRSPRQSGEEDPSGCLDDELALVGFPEDTEIAQIFEPTGHVWVHHCCALWSEGVTVGQTQQLEDVDKAVYNAMSNRCAHCRKFGATLVCCIPYCGKKFHFPCASAGGCFQDMKTLSLVCAEHINQVEATVGSSGSACCIQCSQVGNVKEQLFCTSCGHHYHGNCLCPPVDMKPIVRAGWQCPNCKICQTCRTASDDSKMLVCDKCDKGYHTFCLKPVMTTIPKNGWKCKNCRICTDCGSRTPGSGPSSRWHLNYSVCDSCYQQRNKGLCCPLCGKAYRHFHNKTMLPCMVCKKFVHIECDLSINPNALKGSKDNLPQDYVCTVCREMDPSMLMDIEQHFPSLHHAVSEESMESFLTDEVVSKENPMLTEAAIPEGRGVLTASSSQESLFVGEDSSSSFDFDSEKSLMSPTSRRDSVEISSKKGKHKRHSSAEKHQYSHHHHHHHHHHHSLQSTPPQQQQQQQQSLGEKRRGPKIKVKIGGQVVGITSMEDESPIPHTPQHSFSSAASPAYSSTMEGMSEEKDREKDKKQEEDEDDDEDDQPSTLIISESNDKFVMDQDVCKACGAFGKEEENKMIVCTQCGQCYHPYCVSVSVTTVMLQKGWRCLDCTVCEGCGGPDDEGRLLLCDDCDISYHTYCLDPPLETVPKGNWKCKWCVMCVNCGTTSPGFACQWQNNYTQCGPCHSKMQCPVCDGDYLLDQLIIQCQQCDRWLHCECDGLTCEDEAEIASDYGYHCVFCRPRTGKIGPLPPPPPPPSPPKEEHPPSPPAVPYIPPVAEPQRQFLVDGVYLFASGLTQIQKLQVTNPKKLKQQQQLRRVFRSVSTEENEESSSAGANAGESGEVNQEETGEDGVKKRKPRRVFGLGVGGFIVRQRSRQWLAKRQASYEEPEEQEKGAGQPGEKTDKQKRRRKIKKTKTEEQFPFYMQEAFFGKSIMEQTKETTKGLLKTESDSEYERSINGSPTKMAPVIGGKEVPMMKTLTGDSLDSPTIPGVPGPSVIQRSRNSLSGSEQSEDMQSLDESDLKDILPPEFQENDDIFSLIHEELKDDGLSLEGMDTVTSNDGTESSKTGGLEVNLDNMLSPDMEKDLDVDHIISEGFVHFDTVEDIFSGVLSDPQNNQTTEQGTSSGQFGNMGLDGNLASSNQDTGSSLQSGQHHPGMPPQGVTMRPGQQGLPPFGMPFNQAYGGPLNQPYASGMGPGPSGPSGPPVPSVHMPPWGGAGPGIQEEEAGDSNKRNILKWEQEEEMGDQATISCVLYVNMCHPDLKQKYPDWSERSKQIAKLWRKLTPDEKSPYLSKARKNRTSNRVLKTQKHGAGEKDDPEKKAEAKAKNQLTQELQRRQEAQKRQDSEAMPPPPAPPPLPPGEHYHDGTMMNPMASPYGRHGWQDEGTPSPAGTQGKPPNTPDTPDQVFPPTAGTAPPGGQTVGAPVSRASPDPYAFPSPGVTEGFPSPRAVGPRPPHRLPGLNVFGGSPREEEGPGMGSRVRPNLEHFPMVPGTPGHDMYSDAPRRLPGPGPRMSLPNQAADASAPLGDSSQPRPPGMSPGDPYAFPPGTPQTPVGTPEEGYMVPPGTPDSYPPGRPRPDGGMYGVGSPQMRASNSMPTSPYPGSPVRMPDPGFRHPLARSTSMPGDPSFAMQQMGGPPRAQLDPSMSRNMSDHSAEAMYRGPRMQMQPHGVELGASSLPYRGNKSAPCGPWAFPYMLNFATLEGVDGQGNIHPQHLRVILGQQTKIRIAKKQEEERMMGQGPGWPEGAEGMEGFPPRPPFRGPAPPGSYMARPPHPGMMGPRRPYFPGNMPVRSPMGEQYPGQAQEGMMAEQRSQFVQMMQDRMSTGQGAPAQQQMSPMFPPNTDGELQQGQVAATSDTPTTDVPAAPSETDELFTGGEGGQSSLVKAAGSEDGSTVESEVLLAEMDEKAAKPSVSSEDDKNEDDDLLKLFSTPGADGTFDILKFADPDLDLDLDEKMFEHLDFMEDEKVSSQNGDTTKKEEDKPSPSKSEDRKDPKEGDVTTSKDSDFQAQFLEFNQRHDSEFKKEKEEDGKSAEEKEKNEVGQIAALLQGTESIATRLPGGDSDVKPSVDGMGGVTAVARPGQFNIGSPHMSPSQPSGLPSPKIMHSPRSGQPSPRTPNMQSPFNALLGGRHSASPHSQPLTPGGAQLSPFSTGGAQVPFSPPASSQFGGQGTGSAPHSPYPLSSQPQFSSIPPSGPGHMIGQGYPPVSMGGPRPPVSYSQTMMGPHGGMPRPTAGYGPMPIRAPDGSPLGRFPRPGMDPSMEGVEGLGPRMPQPMTLPDGRPHPMFQQMQARGMRGPHPVTSTHPSLQQQLSHPQGPNRHPFPPGQQGPPVGTQPPRLSHPPPPGAVRGSVPRQMYPGGHQGHLLVELVEEEKEHQKRQAEQQALMHRRDGGPPLDPGMVPQIVSPGGGPPVSGVSGPPMPPHSGAMQPGHPGMRLQGPPPEGAAGPWPPQSPDQGPPSVGHPPGQFPQGFPPRMMHPGMGQRMPFPAGCPTEPMARPPGPMTGQPMGPPTPVKAPSGEMGPEFERQAAQYEDWLSKQAVYLESQVKSFETQVNKLKRSKKSIQARQRLAKKNGQELNPSDTAELERITTEQSGLQKQLEGQRKLLRQHQHLVQDYRTKQQEQYGRMWTGTLPETPIPGTSGAIPPPRTPGGQNSVRLSPTARQEYEAYMQNRIRMANQQQQHQQGPRMRGPTAIHVLGDNNPFSEGFQQREIHRAPLPPGSAMPPNTTTPPIPHQAPPGLGPPTPGAVPQHPPFSMGPMPPPHTDQAQPPSIIPTTTTAAAATTTSSETTGVTLMSGTAAISTTTASTSSPSATPVTTLATITTPSSSLATTPTSGPSPLPPSTPTAPPATTTATSVSAASQPSGVSPVVNMPPQLAQPGSMQGSMGPRGPMEGMPPAQYFREKGMPFDGNGFPRPQGPGPFPEAAGPRGQNPHLPPYPGGPSIYPGGPGVTGSVPTHGAPPPGGTPAQSMDQTRMPFGPQGNMPPFQQGLGLASSELPRTNQAAGPEKKKKRKKKKKSDDLEGAQSQPLPPSLPNQAMLGQLSSQTSSTTNTSTVTKPVEMHRPQSETERRILEILNNSQKELQNPPSPSSTRGGKSPRSKSPARAQTSTAQSAEADKTSTAGIQVASTTAGTTQPAVTGPVASTSGMSTFPYPGGDNKGHTMGSQAGVTTTVTSEGVTHGGQSGPRMGLPSGVSAPHMAQHRLPMHSTPPHGFAPQHHMQQLQNLARMQQYQQYGGLTPDGQRTPMPADPQAMGGPPVAGPRHPQLYPYSQRQRFPTGQGPLHPYRAAGPPPHLRGYHMAGMPQRMPSVGDPRMAGQGESPTHLHPQHPMIGPQRMPPASMVPVPPHHPGGQMTTGQGGHPPNGHLPISQAGQIAIAASTPSSLSTPTPASSTDSSTSSSITPLSSTLSFQSSTPSTTASSSTPSPVPTPTANIPDVNKDGQPNAQSASAAAATSSSPSSQVSAALVISSQSSIPVTSTQSSGAAQQSTGEREGTKDERTKKVCDDGVHCGTDDEEEVPKKKVCDDGVHCGTDDEEEVPKKKVCDDGVHCGTDDEEEVPKKKVCDDGVHCGTDDEEEVPPKNVCDDGVHCGTDDEEEVPKKKVCDDGVHCGTDDEEEVPPKNVCDDGVHCGTDDEEEVPQKNVCDDGVHCGTDDEEEVPKKKVCDDGVHCGTDDEEEVPKKKVCDDGVHCGTDDEEEVPKKKVCDDGVHCGTDDEEEARKKKVCDDGVHCGTDDEEETPKKKGCDDGVHCGTDDEEEVPKKKVCDDGVHCGTDDEEEVPKKKVCDDGVHCGTDDEEEIPKKKVCDDGVHCGTDDEEEIPKKKVCDDGVHCGTDDEEEIPQKKVCDDGVHCGTDDEDEVDGLVKKVCEDGMNCGTDDEDKRKEKGERALQSDVVHCSSVGESISQKKTCDDGMNCGTDEEDEGNIKSVKNGAGVIFCGTKSIKSAKNVCSDGMNCGTIDDDEEEDIRKEKVCSDGKHCGTDDEAEEERSNGTRKVGSDGLNSGMDDEVQQSVKSTNKNVCSDGMNCGTDDEEEGKKSSGAMKAWSDGISCQTNDEDVPKKTVCSDGQNCGTDDEDEMKQSNGPKKVCNDGMNCGTDDEEEPQHKPISEPNRDLAKAQDNGNPIGNVSDTSGMETDVNNKAEESEMEIDSDDLAVPKGLDTGLKLPTSGPSDITSNETDQSTAPAMLEDISSQIARFSHSLANFKPQIFPNTSESVSSTVRPSDTLTDISISENTKTSTAVTTEVNPRSSTISSTSSNESALPASGTETVQRTEKPVEGSSAVSMSSSALLVSEPTGHSAREEKPDNGPLTSHLSAQNSYPDSTIEKMSTAMVKMTTSASPGPKEIGPPLSVSQSTPVTGTTSSSLISNSNTMMTVTVNNVSTVNTQPVTSTLTVTVSSRKLTTSETVTPLTSEPSLSSTDATVPQPSPGHSDDSPPASSITTTTRSTTPSTTITTTSVNPTTATSRPGSAAASDQPQQRQVIPPLRIRMDPQSQPQVYETSPGGGISGQRDYYRSSSEYSSPGRSKAEGDLKLVLRKSSDGTAELISGPSFREKSSKRSTPVADIDSPTPSSKSDTEVKSGPSTPSPAGRVTPSTPTPASTSQPSRAVTSGLTTTSSIVPSSAASGQSIKIPDMKPGHPPVSNSHTPLVSSMAQPHVTGPYPGLASPHTQFPPMPPHSVTLTMPHFHPRMAMNPRMSQAGVGSRMEAGMNIGMGPRFDTRMMGPRMDAGMGPQMNAGMGPRTENAMVQGGMATPGNYPLPSTTQPSTATVESSKERTEPFTSDPSMFKNVRYTKMADSDVVKINVGSSKTTPEGTPRKPRSYTTDIQALERLQSTIDAVASGESSLDPDTEYESPSRVAPSPSSSSQDSQTRPPSATSRPPSSSSMSPFSTPPVPTTTTTGSAVSIAEMTTGYPGQYPTPRPPGPGMPHHQMQNMAQQHKQLQARGMSPHPQQLQHMQQPPPPPGGPYMQPQYPGQYRMTRPPLGLLAQASQTALSSAGTAIPTSSHPTSQADHHFMADLSPSRSEHSPMHSSPHQPYPGPGGMLGPGMGQKGVPQSPQPFMPPGTSQAQQYMPPGGPRFPPRIHHDMTGGSPYGMSPHPMSPTGMHRQRPHFPGGDMSRMPRPPRGMHPQHRQMPPEIMGPEYPGMQTRMPHQFMSPTHPGMSGEMPPVSHGIPQSPHAMQSSPHTMQSSPHGMQSSPHGMQSSPHGLQTSPHGLQSSPHGMPLSPHGMPPRGPLMSPRHPMMSGAGPSPLHPQTSMGGPPPVSMGGGPLASLANFQPPGHPGISTSMASPIPPHHQRPPMFPQMMGSDARMAARLRMMAASGDGNMPPGAGPHMGGPHFPPRHMMPHMRGMGPHPSAVGPQASLSPHMSPHMSPQMSPIMGTQPLRHLDSMHDEKTFMQGGVPTSMDPSMQARQQRSSFASGMGDASSFLPGGPLSQMVQSSAASDSGSVVSTPGLTSPMSDVGGMTSQVKLEPSEDSASADGSINRDDLDIDQRASHNELLKQLLGTGGRQLPTPDSEDSLPALTPEQQRQLEMIDSMPLCKETELPDWENKTQEEKEKILEMRRQEYEMKRQEYEVSRKNKRKVPGEKKKRKKSAGLAGVQGEATGEPPAKKRSKKAKLKENQTKEMEAQVENFLQQLHNMPQIHLQEPILATSMSILPVKGASALTGVTSLRGRFCSAYLDGVTDLYGSLLFPQPPPGLRPTIATAQIGPEGKLARLQASDQLQMMKFKDIGGHPGPRTSPRLILPPQPRIEIKTEQMRDRKEERETPDTVVSSSSPEFGFNEQDSEYPGLRPIDPATPHLISGEDNTSPVMPLVHPLPFKPGTEKVPDMKPELALVKQESNDLDSASTSSVSLGIAEEGSNRHLTVNLPNLTSGLAQPFLDPALDQQVSVTLTLSTGAAQDIGAVISAIADLLKIAVPPTYEITRSPSPEMFRMTLTHKEEAVNIHTLMSTRPRYCAHCDVFVLCSGIAKFKREFPILLEQDPDCGDEEMIFCSMNCSIQFSAGLETRQRQKQLREEEEAASTTITVSGTAAPVQIKTEAGSTTPSTTTVTSFTPKPASSSSNVDDIIAAVAADASLSPRGSDTPGVDTWNSPASSAPTSPLPSTSPGMIKAGKRYRRSSSQISEPAYPKPMVKKWRGQRWKRGHPDIPGKVPSTLSCELDRLWTSLGIIHRPDDGSLDKRHCHFCQGVGDGESEGASRLLNMDVNKWVHLNCALWSYDVYETLNGALMNVELAAKRSMSIECVACHKLGATLACFKPRCTNAYHLPCAQQRGCMFYQDKTLLCPNHIPKVPLGSELHSLVVLRRVYINRDPDRQVANMLHLEDRNCCLRVGSLTLHNIGQLLPHQILSGKFNSKEYIYPVGFCTSRFYWSYHSVYKRCRYVCSIHDKEGMPEFRVKIKDKGCDDVEFSDITPAAVWMRILEPIEQMRRRNDLVKMFPTVMAAEELFGLREPNIVKILESLPGTDLLQNYNFKYGRSPLIEMPPAINPTGCARTEPKLRTHFRRPHTLQSTNSRSLPSTVTGVSGDMNSPYLKQFVHSKSQQYRRLKTDWKTLVYLGRSRIQGLGLYAARDLEKHTMVIEYIGDLIRNEVANRREKEYEAQNRGVYMFRIDNDVVIDATMAGGPARYINHSCNPNCVAEVVDIEKDSKIIIITSRKIAKGEELTYDYKFDFEDDQHKIPCNCGATNCRKWMN